MKHCAHCHAEMRRPQKVSYAQWERQLYCSKRCANLAGACRAGNGVVHERAPHPLLALIAQAHAAWGMK